MSLRDELASAKPILRGWSHAIAAVIAIIGTIFLAINAHDDPTKLLACLVYGVSLVLLLGFSATYHIPHWSPAWRAVLRRIDHANIFIFIAATNTPVAVVLLTGAWRWTMLIAIWTIAIAGVAAMTPVIRARRRVLTGAYIGVGWVGLLMFPQLIASVGAAALLIAAGGLLYSVGAVVYATRRPNLWPRVFGYHEVFHLLVIAASVAFYVFMIGTVAPHRVQ